MANHKSSKKSVRQIAKRTVINKTKLTKMRTFIKKLEIAIEKKDKKILPELFKSVQSLIMKGVTHKLLKKNTASRKISRLSLRMKKIA